MTDGQALTYDTFLSNSILLLMYNIDIKLIDSDYSRYDFGMITECEILSESPAVFPRFTDVLTGDLLLSIDWSSDGAESP